MQSIRAACLIIAITSVMGCATAPSLQGARPASSRTLKYGLAKSEIAAKADHMNQHLNESKSVTYFQNQGGGGAGLGLLLGPLGVIANVKMIESTTTADVEKIKGKINLNPEVAFQQAAIATNFSVQNSANPGDVKVTPYVLISKTDQSTLHISSVVFLEGVDEQRKWTRRYQYQLPGKYTLDELSKLSTTNAAEVQAASVNAYASLLKQITEETDSTIASEKRIVFKSPYLSPRFELEMNGSLIGESNGRVWVRSVLGVAAIDPASIQYQVAKN